MVQVEWEFSEGEIDRIRDVIREREHDPFVTKRRKHNVREAKIDITEDQFWDVHLMALLTSQQRSGPDSHVSQFLKNELHRLELGQCREEDDISQFIAKTLEAHGGIRYYNNIGDACEKNLQRLDSGGWSDLLKRLDNLIEQRNREPVDSDYATEREVAIFLSAGFAGEGLHRIGPKQSRNMLQMLGLTRYETPLDSRITKWLNTNLDLPYHITGGGLNNPEFYHFIMDIVQRGCSQANVLPCVFDAAVFTSYDGTWTEEDAEAIF